MSTGRPFSRSVRPAALVATVALASLAGCGRSWVWDDKPQSLTVEPRTADLFHGATVQLRVTAKLPGGAERDVTAAAQGTTYAVEPADWLQVSAQGLVTARTGEGTATLTATWRGVSDRVEIVVRPPRLESLAVEPVSARLAVGASVQLRVTGRWEGGRVGDLTTSAETVYASLATTVARVSRDGQVTGVAAGRARILVTHGELSAGVDVEVEGATVEGLSVRPDSATLAEGERLALAVLAHLSDGGTLDVTSAATGTRYESERPDIAAVSADGVVTAVRAGGPVLVVARNFGRAAAVRIAVLPRPSALIALHVRPETATLAPGARLLMRAIASYEGGGTADVTTAPETSWRSDAPAVAATSAVGIVLAVAPGEALVTASHGGREAAARITVAAAPPKLVSLQVSPSPVTGRAGDTVHVSVTGRYDDGSTADLTGASAGTLYGCDHDAVAVAAPDGRVLLVAAGETTLRVANGAVEASAPVRVEPAAAVLVRLEAVPAWADLAPGDTRQLAAVGVYDDGSRRDLTGHPDTRFESDLPSVALVDAAGLVTAVSPGRAQVTVLHGALRADVRVNVAGGPVLTALEVGPSALELAPGASVQLLVRAMYSDGSVRDVGADPATRYECSDPATAVVSATGLVTAVALDERRATITVRHGILSAAVAVHVRAPAPVLLSLRIEPSPVELAVGATLALRATGLYSDGGARDLTSDPATVWTVDDRAIALFSHGSELLGVAPGTTVARAVHGAVQARADVRVRVAPPVLLALRVEPDPVQVVVGSGAQLRVTGTFSDGGTADLTAHVATTYLVDDAAVATASAAGLVQGVAPGETTLRVRHGAVSATVPVRVHAGQLMGIQIEPAQATLSVGARLQLRVVGVYSLGVSIDITADPQLHWKTTDPAVAAVAGGLVTAVAPGSATIRVVYGESGSPFVSLASITVEAQPPTPVALEVQPASLVLRPGESAALRVRLVMSDGTTRDVTLSPETTYLSRNASVAVVSAGGLVAAAAPGATLVEVRNGALSATVSVLVPAATLVSIDAEPGAQTLLAGGTFQLRVTGTYSDGRTADLTAGATGTRYQPSAGGVVSAGIDGLVTALRPGSAVVSVVNGAATDTVTVVVERTVLALEAVPSPLALGVGESQRLSVTATFDDGTSLVVDGDPALVFESTEPAVASVAADGTVRGVAVGATRVRVHFDAGLSEATASVPVTVEDRFVSLEVVPSFATVSPGETLRLTVWGVRRDGSRVDLTTGGSVTYTTSDAAVAKVANGVVTGVAEGMARIEARRGTLSAVLSLRVARPGVARLELQPASLTLEHGATGMVTVRAYYEDGAMGNVTADPRTTYVASNPAVAVASAGVVTAVGPGSTAIVVSFGGASATLSVLVTQGLVGLAVTPASFGVLVGATQPLRVTATFLDGSSRDVTSDAATSYASSAPAIATVSPRGVVAGVAPGNARIDASFGGRTASADATVRRPPAVVRLVLSPAALSLEIGATQQLQLTGVRDDGSTVDLTHDAGTAWRVTGAAIAAVSATGLVTAVAAGSTQISATWGGLAATAAVQVKPPHLVSIDAKPDAFSVNKGGTVQLVVTGRWSDGSTSDLTRASTGTTYQAGGMLPVVVVTVSADGLVTGVLAGATTNVTARNSGLSDTVTVTVTRTLVRLDLTPTMVTVATGATAQLVATATWDDGTTTVVGSDPACTWTSLAPGVATVSRTGLVTGVAAGVTAVRATYGGKTASARVLVVATNPIVALEVAPAAATLFPGGTLQLAVTGVRADGSRTDLTGDPATLYSIDNASVAAVSTGGLVTALAEGSATITVRHGTLSAVAAVLVRQPLLVALELSPASLTLEHGDTGSVRATARYEDGSTRDVTTSRGTAWISGNPAVATAAIGVVTAVGPGATIIVVSFGGRTALLSVTVTPKLVGLRVEPASASVEAGRTLQLKVVASYLDGSTRDVTSDPGTQYASAAPAVATVGATGLVAAVAAGTARIDATFGGLTASSAVTVTRPPAVITSLSPRHVLVGAGATLVRVLGSGFDATSRVWFDNAALTTQFVNAGELRFTVPAAATSGPGFHPVFVRTPGLADSNLATFWVVSTRPTITGIYPSAGARGARYDVTILGTGLGGVDVATSNPGIAVGSITYATDGTRLSASFQLAANAALGAATVTVSNGLGQATTTFTVLDAASCTDLLVRAGTTVTLSGTQLKCSIVVETGARVIAGGLQPLVLQATRNIVIMGRIEANGVDGGAGYHDPADGGAAGAGGGGGGGGGDGAATWAERARGGAGSPPGQDGSVGDGAGTASGAGGGRGRGLGISGGCGQGGGGGGYGGRGGNGGGDRGVGTGGAGGPVTVEGSDYNGGSGGGGGSTCGGNSGGGGGGGGGVVRILAPFGGSIQVLGAVQARGGRGGCGFSGTGNGGGGSGGLVEISSEGGAITIADTLSVRGGDSCDGSPTSGDGGGGGGGGRIVVDAHGGGVTADGGFFEVSGGYSFPSTGGGYAGQNGADGVATVSP